MSKKIIWEKWNDPFTHQEADGVPILLHNGIGGIIPVSEGSKTSKHFNFWIGHTNFYISKEIFETINRCPGVEILNIFTPYRFRISIGKAFSEKVVQKTIMKDLGVKSLVDPSIKAAKKLKKQLSLSNKYWAILLLPTGKTTHTATNNIEVFERNYDLLKEAKKSQGGRLFSSKKNGT